MKSQLDTVRAHKRAFVQRCQESSCRGTGVFGSHLHGASGDGKTKEAASLDKAASELKTDLDGVQDELDAVNFALGTITAQCVAKPETYAERKESQAMPAVLAEWQRRLMPMRRHTAAKSLPDSRIIRVCANQKAVAEAQA